MQSCSKCISFHYFYLTINAKLGNLLMLQKVKDIPVGPVDSKDKTPMQRALAQTLWFISTSRNILVVVFCAVMAYMFNEHHMQPFVLSGNYVSPYWEYMEAILNCPWIQSQQLGTFSRCWSKY